MGGPRALLALRAVAPPIRLENRLHKLLPIIFA